MDASFPGTRDSNPAQPAVTPLLRTVLLCDLVESTALVERLGDARAAGLLQRHDQLLRQTLALTQGQLVDKADGVLALFERPLQALDFALRYQRGLRQLGIEEGVPLQARTGIHVGDVMTWSNSPQDVRAGAKPVEVEGLAKPVAARLMGLALPGQILMSGMAQSLAQRAQGELGEAAGSLRWLLHGRYRFKGVPVPMLVHEVGEVGVAPLRAPPSGAKAWRELPLWRRPPVLALELLLVVGVVLGLAWSTLRSPPAIAFAERDWVVVADLQNRTSEPLFDDALDAAFRIGLEQSAYVNLMPETRVRAALARMQRSGSPIDRQLGGELALREGARALVLPAVAEVGGRLRVSIEVIDPVAGATVYSHSADSTDREGVMAAMDEVLGQLRADLGESLASLSQRGKPLDEVTTPDLEALRAFSLAQQARSAGKYAEALALFQQAVKRDPAFSMAYLRMAFLMYGENDNAEAKRYLDLAESHRQRLSDREALLLDASRAIFDGPAKMLEKWRLMAAIYPDEYRAYFNFAYFAHNDAQRDAEALAFLAPALSPNNPSRASAYYLQGVLQLVLGRTEEALASFQQSQSLGVGGFIRDHADAHASRRDYAQASKLLATQSLQGLGGAVLEERLADISHPLDQGRYQASLDAAAALAPAMQSAPALSRASYDLLRLSLRSYAPDVAFPGDLRRFLQSRRDELAATNALDRRHVVFQLLAAGALAARGGDGESARQALVLAGELAEGAGYPANADMARVLRAELALADGAPKEAVALLAPRAGASDESYYLHAVLMRAHAAAGDHARALAEAQWLAGNRGRAYAEFNSLQAWQPANLVESNLALAAAARYADAAGQPALAKEMQAAFAAAWPGAEAQALAERQSSRQ